MIRIELTAQIACPPENVFAALTGSLVSSGLAIQRGLSPRPKARLQLGAQIREDRRMMGREIDNELEVTVYDPPRRFALEARSGPVPLSIDHELVEDNGQTVVHVRAQAEPGALFKLAGADDQAHSRTGAARRLPAPEGSARGRGLSGRGEEAHKRREGWTFAAGSSGNGLQPLQQRLETALDWRLAGRSHRAYAPNAGVCAAYHSRPIASKRFCARTTSAESPLAMPSVRSANGSR